MSSCAGMSPKRCASPSSISMSIPGRDLLESRRQPDVAVQTYLVVQNQRPPVFGENEPQKGNRSTADRDVGLDGRVPRLHVDTLAVDAQTKHSGAPDVEIDDLARQSGDGVTRFGIELEHPFEQSPEQAERRFTHSRSGALADAGTRRISALVGTGGAAPAIAPSPGHIAAPDAPRSLACPETGANTGHAQRAGRRTVFGRSQPVSPVNGDDAACQIVTFAALEAGLTHDGEQRRLIGMPANRFRQISIAVRVAGDHAAEGG